MHVMGDDFWYANATKNFENMDNLINYINEYQYFYGLNITYATPSNYL